MPGRRIRIAIAVGVVVVAVVAGGLQLRRLATAREVAAAVSPVAVAVDTPSSRHPRSNPPRPQPPVASDRITDGLRQAASLAAAHQLRAGIAVLDTRTGRYYRAGAADEPFATGSVVKVMIAAYLLSTGQLTGSAADLAYSMITRSDDDAANVLWGKARGPSLEPWIAAHYGIEGLGAPNSRQNVWGNTHVTARGLVQLYAKLEADPMVWPWLGAAMHHVTRVAKDGTDQSFGLSAAAPGAAVKQGWASGSADNDADAVVNTTGLVVGDRYAVAILTEGLGNNDSSDAQGFNAGQASVVTAMARQIIPALG